MKDMKFNYEGIYLKLFDEIPAKQKYYLGDINDKSTNTNRRQS